MRLLFFFLLFLVTFSALADTYYDESSFEEESYLTDYFENTESQIQDDQYDQNLDEAQNSSVGSEAEFISNNEFDQASNDY